MQQNNKSKIFRPAILATSIALLLSGHTMAEQINFHKDSHRTTAKLIFEPATVISKEINVGLAKAYINKEFRRFGLSNARSLKLIRSSKSLLGTHYHFGQFIGDIAIDKAEVIVTVANNGHTISKVFNNAYKISPRTILTRKPRLTADQAIDNSWNILQVRDRLTSVPNSKLVYHVGADGKFKLTYRVHIGAEGDTGGRMMYIDADNGSLVDSHSTTLPRHGKMRSIAELNKRTTPVLSRQKETRRMIANSAIKLQASAVPKVLATTTALVFDPDPRTTLADETLEDNFPASSFDAAYLTRSLQGLAFSNGVYSFAGEYVNITEIETPTTAPSTSTGNWTAKRGNNAFNDATTYFHLDQNQRYIQSLGFTGATGIIERALRVDTDGVQGADNSHYSYGGSSDYLAFGHGGVDDNEDADVILHEYGHAIHRNINNNWSGGDTGAMGEGFGDYWAGSYSYSTPNGETFNPDEVFTWDGQSASSWPGRVMNLTTAQYDPSKSYPAHSNVNGINGDELWSTPLFQALKELMTQGRPRSEMDQIILQAHFGLGSNLTMRDVAGAIVAAAAALYPSGPHADVYQAHFENHNMLEGDTPPPGTTVLENGVAETSLSASSGNYLNFTLEVPAGATDINFNMSGGSGDADLYVKFGSAPTDSSYDCRPYVGGNAESCTGTSTDGTYYVRIKAYSTFSGVSLTGSYTEGSGGTGGSSSESNISVGRKAWKYYTVDIPAGMATFNVNLSGGTGDADLYIRRGANNPTTSTYDCRSWVGGNTESCSFNSPTADTWKIGIYGYTAASGITLNMVWNP